MFDKNQPSTKDIQINISSKLLDIFKIIPDKVHIKSPDETNIEVTINDGRSLLSITDSNITFPIVSLQEGLFSNRSNLKDTFVPQKQIENLFEYLSSNDYFTRLNHVGICYAVKSIDDEKKRLMEEVKGTRWHLYEEASSDESTWLFIGDKTHWQDPLLELVLVESTQDKWKNYWLPHIQIDVDTFLHGDEIKKLIIDTFDGKVQPYPLFETDTFVVIYRARLGVVSGVNINLDLGFEGRMPRHHRMNMLKQLI